MSVTINGTTGIANVDGSAASPAFRNTDANSGVSGSADQVIIATAGSERLRLASAGQLGIAGANYGTSGHVLTSGGASAAPSWAAPDQSYFYAYRSSVQDITSDTITKVQYQSLTQSDSAFDLSNDKWTATAADVGAWMFISQISFYTDGNDGNNCFVKIYKNGSQAAGGYNWIWRSTNYIGHFVSTIQFMDVVAADDYYESYGRIQGSGNEGFFGGDSSGGYKQTSFVGFKL